MRSNRFTVLYWRIVAVALMLCALCAGSLALSWNGFTLVEWWRESHSGVIVSEVRTSQPLAALTFDDGPDPRDTPQILKILMRNHIHATFFEIGKNVDRYPALARAVRAQGNVIGNHTYNHPYLNCETKALVHREVADCDLCFARAMRLHTHLFRPPRGSWNPIIYREARADGDRIVLWSVALEHHDARTPKAMAARVLRLIRPGGIILMHDGPNRENTVRALPILIDGLRKRHYRFVTVPELLEAGTPKQAHKMTRIPERHDVSAARV